MSEVWLKPWADCLTDPNHLISWLKKYLFALKLNNYSEVTLQGYRQKLLFFIRWCLDRDLASPQAITPPLLERFRRTLFHHRSRQNQALAQRTQHGYLVALRSFFSWLTQEKVLPYNPASALSLPRLKYQLPKGLLSSAEVELVINEVDICEPLGLRDRSLLETLYSTGMRRMEITQLKLNDVDMDRGMVLVQEGKGGKDRYIPIGDRAVFWLEKYLTDQRPYLKNADQHQTIYVSCTGKPIRPGDVTRRVRKYIAAAALGKEGSCHLLRHSMATAMLENGADVRFIQEQLGHSNLNSTQIYTQVSALKLKEVHQKTHPARLEKVSKNSGLNHDVEETEDGGEE